MLKLIEAGKQLEKDNALSLARNQYRKALEVDPEAHEARQALKRVTALINEQEFRQAMSAGLTALWLMALAHRSGNRAWETTARVKASP